VESQVITEEYKPFLDADAFQQLLAAAYVIQQQNDLEQLEPEPEPGVPISTKTFDSEETLSIIAETQELLRSLPYDRTAAANLVAERLQTITGAAGVAIALERENHLEYCAALGTAASLAGSKIPLTPDGSQTGSATQPTDESSLQEDSDEDQNTVALPLRHEGKVAGIMEVRFNSPNAIHEREVRSCQLMAGLMTEALARAADVEWKRALASERATMLEALERIMPQLERLASEPSEAKNAKTQSQPPADETAVDPSAILNLSLQAQAVCPSCGHKLGSSERFCGKCGTPRPDDAKSADTAPLDLASMLNLTDPDDVKESEEDEADKHEMMDQGLLSDEQLASLVFPDAAETQEEISDEEIAEPAEVLTNETNDANTEVSIESKVETQALVTQPANPVQSSPWTSSVKARKWLESLRTFQQKSAFGIWLSKHRANLYIAIAVALFVVATMGWGWRTPNPPPGVSHRPQQATMTAFEKLLVDLDLAEPPTAPAYNGNPATQVWVDLHTALYYCPGSDLYGKTQGGRFTSQRDAQLDQFEPAERKICN
jgi:hypothetical protein